MHRARQSSALARLPVLILLLLSVTAGAQVAQTARKWLPLAKDGIHDPKNPALRLLQEPAEALSRLPVDTAGNQVHWVQALERGVIDPRTNILPGTQVMVIELDIYLNMKGGTPIVRFPHRAHTLWLDCTNCHQQLFVSKAGGNKLSMTAMLNGEQCGVCHGAVAFPLTECNRCHNTPRDKPLPAGALRGL
jgi:c(7)-type cytochrome triheme protein